MPFVRISLKDNRTEKERQSIGDCVHRAMVKAIGIPEGDRFQVITEHDADLIYDPDYLNIHRTTVGMQTGSGTSGVYAQAGTDELKRKATLKPWLSIAEEHGFQSKIVFINLVCSTRSRETERFFARPRATRRCTTAFGQVREPTGPLAARNRVRPIINRAIV